MGSVLVGLVVGVEEGLEIAVRVVVLFMLVVIEVIEVEVVHTRLLVHNTLLEMFLVPSRMLLALHIAIIRLKEYMLLVIMLLKNTHA